MEKILNTKNIFLDEKLVDQKSVFEFIANAALKDKVISDSEALINGFNSRESEGSTGFEDGFAIPHARIKEAKEAAIYVVRLANGIEWNSMDGKPTKVIIALIVPDGKNDEHLAILSDVAVKLMDSNFKKVLNTATDAKKVLEAFSAKKQVSKTKANKEGLNILAITSCVTGIAHTYMAEEKLLNEVPKMGHNIRVETHGSKGVGNAFSQKEIENADLVIFAVDINIDNSRFAGKKFYQVKVAKAIKDPQGLVTEAIENGKELSGNSKVSFNSNSKAGKDSVMQHILAGISYMIPVIVMGGIAIAFSLGVAKAIWGPESNTMGQVPLKFADVANGTIIQLIGGQWYVPESLDTSMINLLNINEYAMVENGFIYALNNDLTKGAQLLSEIKSQWGPLRTLEMIGSGAFTLMIPILAGFIGNSIAGRAAIAPAMVGAFIGNDAGNFAAYGNMLPVQTPTGFIGAIVAGLLVGYTVRWINTWNVPRSLAPAMPIFFIPLVVGLGISLLFIYVIGTPIGYVMGKFGEAIESAYTGKGNVGVFLGLGLGVLLGAMASFDMGGPINKIAFVTSSALITQDITQPMGALAAAIPVAPLGMGLSTIFFKKFFTPDERGMGISAIIMGTIGISEGAIPFAIRDPKRAIASNVVGGMVAGGIAGALMVNNFAAHGGPIVAILGAVPYGWETVYFFIAVACGTTVTVLMYGSWMLADAGKPGSVKENHVNYLAKIATNKKDNISEINSSILKLKGEMSALRKEEKLTNKDNSSKLNDLKIKIEKLNSEIVNEKNLYKEAKLVAKTSYKEASKQEKEFIKSQRSGIKEFVANSKENYKKELEKLNSNDFRGNKLAMIENKQNKNLAKENYLNSINNDQVKRREKYVQMYNSKLV
ncbi:PTS system fructose-specific IIABC component [Spiroplasma chinense]|uniref:PTS system fructose-specific IIABC component n=1 Tax=Spiroplasma chinense TaxID=216932 RepID=A0A5B9Y526_9MOLU|nr:fructose-specific PTS transporter subunit EIIC [Spiroplasma chinense]QEH61789.1 PTS system fructose-specific IIABC component [Spiroplasma chinense]